MLYGQEMHYYIVYIAYYSEMNLQICNYVQKWRICCKSVNASDEKIRGIFASIESLPTSATQGS